MESNQERRNFFRIDDEIILQVREIDSNRVPDKNELSDTFLLPSRLEHLTQEALLLSRKIARDCQELTEYLKILEHKIDLIAQALMVSECDLFKQPTQNVKLSTAGLSFDSEVEFKPDQLMELTLLLPPMLIGMMAYGRVVHSQMIEAQPIFHTGVEFLSLNDNDLLARYIVKKQAQQLRELNRKSV